MNEKMTDTSSGRKLPELLAPAGNLEKLKAVILYGADAVYLAGEAYGLRAFADNFTLEEMITAVEYAHARGVKVYVTLNILAHPGDFRELADYVAKLEEIGIDAVIVSDPGVFTVVQEAAPRLEVHISTQASVTNAHTCNFWYKLGVRRIVLARELTLEEIKTIRSEIPDDLELETFVHGAMCMAYSGRCLLSNVTTGRDANRGACAQPCRWKYYVIEEKRAQEHPEEPYTWAIEQDERGSYLFSSKDICMIEHIPALIEAGVNSFKIEGRMKGAFYGAMVTRTYRQAIDRYAEEGADMEVDSQWVEELETMVHRSYDTGFYFDRPEDDAKIAPEQTYHQEGVVVGIVLDDTVTDGYVRCEQRNKIISGDRLEIVQPRGKIIVVEAAEMLDEWGQKVESTPHAQQIFYLAVPDGVQPVAGSFIRRRGVKHGSI